MFLAPCDVSTVHLLHVSPPHPSHQTSYIFTARQHHALIMPSDFHSVTSCKLAPPQNPFHIDIPKSLPHPRCGLRRFCYSFVFAYPLPDDPCSLQGCQGFCCAWAWRHFHDSCSLLVADLCDRFSLVLTILLCFASVVLNGLSIVTLRHLDKVA